MVGESNELAYMAAKKICAEGSHYNPLSVYSGVGMGKTHLLNAIGLEIGDNKKVMFISAERFMYHFVRSIKNNEMDLKQILDSLGVKDSNMDLIDKSILYFALNEMVYGDLDKPVVIDESLRLSKKFSNPDSYKFINANLDKYLKSM